VFHREHHDIQVLCELKKPGNYCSRAQFGNEYGGRSGTNREEEGREGEIVIE
jgi:hypothetical protein